MTPLSPPAADTPRVLRACPEAFDAGAVFDAALAGRRQRLVRGDGVVLPLAVQRWHDDADDEDEWLLGRCTGPTLDLGCGPGRLVVALADRGVPALGVDVSIQAVQRCLERGAAVLHRDAFERLPGEGRWQHVVLADGNIGIGGDPVSLLRRCRALLACGGTVLLELEPGAGLWCGTAYLESTGVDDPVDELTVFGALADGSLDAGPWFPWAVLGPHAVEDVAAEAGLTVGARAEGGRCFVELSPA
ncbi:class I SAM-dependent methyltransferase [Actinomycetospora cinnamomea]|uniref:Methionine biosynthesis protein MetW n=1 Tax=Actinomycetospora cinnamomea TaxID=663609 RepID=A0A2U1FSF0_9PSEU|nr:class I SAM-dependent methyltransferase [Actinomycetospora cinnamomea]PVZ14980.1 methionine biosynthesis protein MetW [Actinomycetospora cinnamomea]